MKTYYLLYYVRELDPNPSDCPTSICEGGIFEDVDDAYCELNWWNRAGDDPYYVIIESELSLEEVNELRQHMNNREQGL